MVCITTYRVDSAVMTVMIKGCEMKKAREHEEDPTGQRSHTTSRRNRRFRQLGQRNLFATLCKIRDQ